MRVRLLGPVEVDSADGQPGPRDRLVLDALAVRELEQPGDADLGRGALDDLERPGDRAGRIGDGDAGPRGAVVEGQDLHRRAILVRGNDAYAALPATASTISSGSPPLGT